VKRFRGVRARLLLAVAAGLGVTLAALVAAFNLFLSRTLSHNATDQARARANATLNVVDVSRGHVEAGEAPDAGAPDTLVWIFDHGRPVEGPRVDPELARAVERLAASPSHVTSAEGFRLVRLPVESGGVEIGQVVGAVSLAPYDRTARVALVASLVLGALVFVVSLLAARLLLAGALRPVARMTRQAETWSERDPEQRFAPGEPHDELTQLAATLDQLLDRLAASLRREQRFSAELSHELRTPLARIAGEAELALRKERTPLEYRAAFEGVLRDVGQLTRTVDALVAAAKYETGLAHGTSDAHAVAIEAASACAGVDVAVADPGRPVRLGVDGELAGRILQPLLENACRYAAERVFVELSRNGSSARIRVRDDGPGVAPGEEERIFEPGVRGSAAAGDGAGLGLSLARRLARAANGDVTAEPGPGGSFVLTLPAA
jgi:signal transduction histidine kinase